MRAVVVGAGPVGLFAARLLADAGNDVTIVDPDPGPPPGEAWRRRGVMQFWHPHAFRPQVRQSLERHAPDLLDGLIAAGMVLTPSPPGAPEGFGGIAGRRLTFEAALRSAVLQDSRITWLQATASAVRTASGTVDAVTTDRGDLPADLVIAATGRKAGLAEDLRPLIQGGTCGQSYVARMYRARDGHDFEVTFPIGGQCRDYQTIVFPQDARTISVLFVRPSTDDAFNLLWQAPVFDAAAAAVPNTAPWTDADLFEPITEPMRGGTLTNTYRGQGELPTGLVFVGDAVCTTNPSAGRGVALGMLGIVEIMRLVNEYGMSAGLAPAFERWCDEHVKPWYDDHVATDEWTNRRYAGDDSIDLDAPLPTGVLVAAAMEDPSVAPLVGPYLLMLKPATALGEADAAVRAKLRGGWQPPYAEGPTRAELLEVMERAADAVPAR